MHINPYQAKYYAYELSKKATSDSAEKFGATLMDAKVEINPYHLYKPLIYLGKNYQDRTQVSPIALDASEKLFLDDLIAYIKRIQDS